VFRLLFEGRQGDGQQPRFVTGSAVTPEYFHLLGIPLYRGRLFENFETDSTPSVAVVNQAMARTYWPGEDAIGKRVKLSPRAEKWTTVVGIVADARTDSLSTPDVPQIYASLYQRQGKHLAILLRGHFETAAITREMRDQVQSINAALPVFGTETLGEAVSASLAVRKFSLRVIMLFALSAVVLAGLGIYGVIAFMVTERTHEIGVRIALGAQPSDVVRMVLRQGAVLVLVGMGTGVLAALVASRAMNGLLFGVTPADPLTFAVVTGLLGVVALAGCYLPARRAVRVDPIVALR
jgi:putative ABC transport system permease protein